MTLDHTSPPEYLVAHLTDALARDPRVAQQGLRIELVGTPPAVVVTGTVVGGRRRAAIVEVISELLPGCAVVDGTEPVQFPEAGQVEDVR